LAAAPGTSRKYLHEQGVTVVGIDLSPEMVRCAASRNPGLKFRVGDMRALHLPRGSLVGLVAFYSIVHFESAELDGVMSELRRVLTLGGLALVSFHVGATSSTWRTSSGPRSTWIFGFMPRAP